MMRYLSDRVLCVTHLYRPLVIVVGFDDMDVLVNMLFDEVRKLPSIGDIPRKREHFIVGIDTQCLHVSQLRADK